jgi:oligosaccharide repeat unit polymerase
MYIFIYAMIITMILIITKIRYNTIVKPNILFSSLWCLSVGISSLGLFGFYKPSILVHFYSFSTIMTFNIIYFFHNRLKSKNNVSINKIKGSLRYNLIIFINIISWVYLSGFIVKSFSIIVSHGFNVLRMYAYDSNMGLGSTTQLILIQWFIKSIFIATILVSIVGLVINRKNNKLIIISIIDVILYTILFGGRGLILTLLLYYIFTFLVTKPIVIDSLKKKKVNIIFIALIVIGAMFVTSQRNWGDASFVKNLVLYFSASFSYLDVLLVDLDWKSSPLFGMATFGFAVDLIYAAFSLVFGIPFEGVSHKITQITAIPRFISPTVTYNAASTMIYPMMRDFGFLGIVLSTSFLALIVSTIESKFVIRSNLIFLNLYIYFLGILFGTIMTYQLIFPATGITLLLIIIFTRNAS